METTPQQSTAQQIAIKVYARIKRTLRSAIALIDHTEIQGEFERLRLLDVVSFEHKRKEHLARKAPPQRSDAAGIVFFLAVIGAPSSFVAGLATWEIGYFFGAAFWLFIGTTLYLYLARIAKYWREHNAIRMEEVRRFGRVSFG